MKKSVLIVVIGICLLIEITLGGVLGFGNLKDGDSCTCFAKVFLYCSDGRPAICAGPSHWWKNDCKIQCVDPEQVSKPNPNYPSSSSYTVGAGAALRKSYTGGAGAALRKSYTGGAGAALRKSYTGGAVAALGKALLSSFTNPFNTIIDSLKGKPPLEDEIAAKQISDISYTTGYVQGFYEGFYECSGGLYPDESVNFEEKISEDNYPSNDYPDSDYPSVDYPIGNHYINTFANMRNPSIWDWFKELFHDLFYS